METGILAIDSMFPIGSGQRELIIGDRQTGKTSIAIGHDSEPEGQGRYLYLCGHRTEAFYSCKTGFRTLEKYGAMDYTTVVCSDSQRLCAPSVYCSPIRDCCWQSTFMYQGKDVLIVYDDLSKHAVAYRALSLLLERSPGREAYPGDVFYLHSRLLERSSRLSDAREAVPSQHFLSLRHRQETYQLIFRPMLFPLQTDRFPGKRSVFLRHASGCQCGSFRIPCRRCGTDKGHEEGIRKYAY